MSAVPQRTQILIKDLSFQTKYHLSHTQMDLMAYFANLSYWATSVNGYYAITSKKIMSDMPQFKIKTLEATIKELKILGLIKTTLILDIIVFKDINPFTNHKKESDKNT